MAAHTARFVQAQAETRAAARPAVQRPCSVQGPRMLRASSITSLQQSAVCVRPFTAVQQSRRSAQIVRVAAQEAPAEAASTTQQWYALVANAEFFCNDVQNEPLAEQLRERVRYFKEQGRPIDFYMVPNPTWLDAKFPQQGKQVARPCVALVSTDQQWITFMKLRLDRVLKIDLSGLTPAEVLSGGEELPEFKKPSTWTAPYSMYTPGWWKVFYPQQ